MIPLDCLLLLLFCTFLFTLMYASTPSVANESNVPKASTEEISVKVSNMPSNNSSGRQTQCLNTPTEGATAKVNCFWGTWSTELLITWHSQIYIDLHFTIHVQPPEGGWEAQEQHLLEMFPKCSLSEARSALSIAKGDMEEAVRLIIEGDVQLSPSPLNVSLCHTPNRASVMSARWRLTSHFCLTLSHPSTKANQGKSISLVADQKLKESILEKWVRSCYIWAEMPFIP